MSKQQKYPMDQIDEMIKKTWVDPPITLKEELLGIPHQYGKPSVGLSWVSLVLNMVLTLWGLGTIYLFKGLWVPALSTFASSVQELSMSWGTWFTNPYVLLFVISTSIATLGWLALDPPKIRSSQ